MIRSFERTDKPRALLLEPLERRCMLNAHVNFSPVDLGSRIGDSIRSHERSTEQRHEVGGPVVAFALPESTRPEGHDLGGQGPRGHQPSQQSEHRPQHFVLAFVPVITVPITLARRVESTNVVVVVRQSNTDPVQDLPLARPDVSDVVVHTLGSSSDAISTAGPQESQAVTEPDSQQGLTAVAQLRRQELVSFRMVESQLENGIEPTDRRGDHAKIVDQQVAQVENQLESLDRWLAEYSQTTNRFSDLESTLDDLAIADPLRASGMFSRPQSVDSDRLWRSPSVQIESDFESPSDDMIWLDSSAHTTSSCALRGVDATDDVFAQSTTGIGWYQMFEFVDPANIDQWIDSMSPVLATVGSTSDLVIDAAQPPSKEQRIVLYSRSVSYAVVAAGVASWQIIQRRKRRGS